MDEMKVQFTLTAPVRVSWPQVFEPKAVVIGGKPQGDPFFSVRFIFPADHPDIRDLRVTGGQLLAKLQPGIDLKTLKPYKDFFWPFKSGDTMIAEAKARVARNNKEYQGYEDYMAGSQTLFAKASFKYPPQLDVFTNGKWTMLNDSNRQLYKDKFYNGMMAVGAVTLAAVKLPTNQACNWGVTCYLNGLAAVDGGARIGQQPVAYAYTPPASVTEGPPVEAYAEDEIPYN